MVRGAAGGSQLRPHAKVHCLPAQLVSGMTSQAWLWWLQSDKAAQVQAALEGLVGVCQLAGPRFMMRRVQTEAWPVLQHLLKHGVPQHKHLHDPAGKQTGCVPHTHSISGALVVLLAVCATLASAMGEPLEVQHRCM